MDAFLPANLALDYADGQRNQEARTTLATLVLGEVEVTTEAERGPPLQGRKEETSLVVARNFHVLAGGSDDGTSG
jgi:hypothetical protein